MHKFGQFDKYTLKNRDNSVTIIPARGGNILELILRGRSIIQGNPTPESLEKNKGSRGIKLIPFPNRIKDGKYHFNGEHQLPINFPKQNHAIHGFLYGKEMKVWLSDPT